MALFLVQHGKSLPKDQDPEKGLSPEGREETRRIADVAEQYAVPVARIVHSGKTRASRTADIFHDLLATGVDPEAIPGIAPMDDVKTFARTLDPQSNIMVVGHLPFMEKLVSYLTAGNENLRVYKFQNSGIVCLDKEGDDWFIKWTLNPHIE